MWIALLGASAVMSLMGAIFYWLQFRRLRTENHEQLESYIGTKTEIGWSDSLVEKLDRASWAKALAPQLKRASVSLKPSEYGAVMFLSVVLITIFMYMGMKAPLWLSIIIGVGGVYIVSKAFLASRRLVYIQKLDDQLSEACRLLSSAARAGLSIPQGLGLVVKEMESPIKDELGSVVQELQLGRDLEVSLRELLNRVSSKDLKVFVNALVIQRRAGGDVSKVLSEMARTMEERKIIHKTIDASIAQSRYSAYLMPVISVFVVFVMSQMIDGFFDLFTTFWGIIVLIVFIGLQLLAFFIIKRIADIRV
ncbi:type II secretion system F family protein [Hazenella coriacea]|uniref:Tight adherence protein B n=1 Tax=Hazenella coriacea TaxID=1179467 RepID=A0A4R3L4L8_9BACL|nr:type II secretion system F family protein [Hazenella coriacea]TCS94262.1 tight adherence protein B [Hazenella coriacea]